HGHRNLSWHPAPARIAGARTAHAHQRPHPEGSEAWRAGEEEDDGGAGGARPGRGGGTEEGGSIGMAEESKPAPRKKGGKRRERRRSARCRPPGWKSPRSVT